MEHFVRCNDCAISRNCRITKNVDSRNCKRFTRHSVFCTPILVYLIETEQADVVNTLLNLSGFSFVERLEYPYFKLQIKNAKKKKK
jgi:hypothetical protein